MHSHSRIAVSSFPCFIFPISRSRIQPRSSTMKTMSPVPASPVFHPACKTARRPSSATTANTPADITTALNAMFNATYSPPPTSRRWSSYPGRCRTGRAGKIIRLRLEGADDRGRSSVKRRRELRRRQHREARYEAILRGFAIAAGVVLGSGGLDDAGKRRAADRDTLRRVTTQNSGTTRPSARSEPRHQSTGGTRSPPPRQTHPRRRGRAPKRRDFSFPGKC